MKKQILSRWNFSKVLFECEVPADVPSGLAMRHALEKAVAQRSRLDLRGACLSGADLRGAYLSGADLSGAYLIGANDQQLPRATPEQAIENLDKVREVVLDDEARLNMGHWHGDDEWENRTCAEETLCGTTHCMAGWLQVCTTEQSLKSVLPHLAGALAAPIAAKMFYRENAEVLEWLRDRKYVAETEAYEKRSAELKARREAAKAAA